MKELKIDVVHANELLKTLEAKGYVEFTNRVPSVMGRNEYLKARITGKGILALDGKWEEPQKGGNVQNINTLIGNAIQSTDSTVNANSGGTFNEFYRAIEAHSELDSYEKDELKRKIAELEDALQRKDKTKFDKASQWLGKIAPWMIQVFSRPEVQEEIKKVFGVA